MFTIATAGHIDHGKSSLVLALTGTDPDRLPEEKKREMTIELGFASFKTSADEIVGIIDVPGHEKFIKTMIAGVGTLDLVLFIVAADDGWMPQSEEHLAILSLLGIKQGFVVLTKVDLSETDWIELVKSDIKSKLKDTFLDGCKIIEFSKTDNRNIDIIKNEIELMLQKSQRLSALNSARLFIDRSFSMTGTGRVVTGTLREGSLKIGQEVIHHPSGEKTKVRALESFYTNYETAPHGIRLAVGLQSLSKANVSKGDLLYYPNSLIASDRLGVKLKLQKENIHLIKHNRKIIFLHGTSEISGKLILPDNRKQTTDEYEIAILQLEREVIAKHGDHYILRLPTPSLLLGGGKVIDPVINRFRRNNEEKWNALTTAANMQAEAYIIYRLQTESILAEQSFDSQTLLTKDQLAEAITNLLKSSFLIKREKYLIIKAVWKQAEDTILQQVEQFHKTNPHLAVMPLAELVSQIKIYELLSDFIINSLISQKKLIRQDAGIKLSSYSAGLSENLKTTEDQLISALQESSSGVVSRKEIFKNFKNGREVYTFLKQQQKIIDLNEQVYLIETYDNYVQSIVEFAKQQGKITVAEARDLTGTSRKVIMPVLEELDRLKITRREGDYRILCQ